MKVLNFKNQHIFLLSDTHGKHRNIEIPSNIDIIIHCGDICNDGNIMEMKDFFEWYNELNVQYKIFINENHDLSFELEPAESKFLIPKGIIWLDDRSIILKNIKIKALSGYFYFKDIDFEKDVDILLSHYPPLGILDNGIGIKQLKDYALQTRPKFHIFGHNHKDYENLKFSNIEFINASCYEQLYFLNV
jgi:predicted phosphodiesterase